MGGDRVEEGPCFGMSTIFISGIFVGGEVNLTCCIFSFEFIIANFLSLNDKAIRPLVDGLPPLMYF